MQILILLSSPRFNSSCRPRTFALPIFALYSHPCWYVVYIRLQEILYLVKKAQRYKIVTLDKTRASNLRRNRASILGSISSSVSEGDSPFDRLDSMVVVVAASSFSLL